MTQDLLFVAKRNGEAIVGFEAPEPLPPPEHLARVADPPSSHEAAREVLASGRMQSHLAVVEACFELHPWATGLELFDLEREAFQRARIGDVELRRRTSNLLEAGRLVRMDPSANPSLRRCSRSYLHSRCYRWARPDDIHRAAEFLEDPAAIPIIDRGAGEAQRQAQRGDLAA